MAHVTVLVSKYNMLEFSHAAGMVANTQTCWMTLANATSSQTAISHASPWWDLPLLREGCRGLYRDWTVDRGGWRGVSFVKPRCGGTGRGHEIAKTLSQYPALFYMAGFICIWVHWCVYSIINETGTSPAIPQLWWRECRCSNTTCNCHVIEIVMQENHVNTYCECVCVITLWVGLRRSDVVTWSMMCWCRWISNFMLWNALLKWSQLRECVEGGIRWGGVKKTKTKQNSLLYCSQFMTMFWPLWFLLRSIRG